MSMNITVIKRDNVKQVEFSRDKIIWAINQAMRRTGQIDGDLAIKIACKVHNRLLDEQIEKVKVSDIETLVEDALMDERKDVAREYIQYRMKRSIERMKGSNLLQKTDVIIIGEDIENSNANRDESVFSGKISRVADELLRLHADCFALSPEINKAFKEQLIYIHDYTRYSIGMHNCLLVDMGDILSRGFDTRNGDVRPPTKVSTAFQQVPVIFQIISNNQFGGVAAGKLDHDLAPYVKMSFRKHFRDIIRYEQGLTEEEAESVLKDIEKQFPIEVGSTCFKNNYLKQYMWALNKTIQETEQGAESLIHNLNNLESRSGGELPFTSINYGTDTTPEGRMVTTALLKARIKGVGSNFVTPIFPIDIFKVKKGVNDKEGTPNYDLFKLAIECCSKRIYPNFANSNDFEDIDEELATMGCVDGREIIKYKVSDSKPYGETFKKAWNRLTEGKTIRKQGLSEYVILDNVKIWDSFSNKFVKCKKIIKNPDRKNWMKIIFNDGNRSILLTEDHPLPITKCGSDIVKRTFARDINVGDYAFSSDGHILEVSNIEYIGFRDECSYDVETESDRFDVSGIKSHNCRTQVGYDVNGMGNKKEGRGNISPVTINLPRVALKAGNKDNFYKELDKALELTVKALLERFEYQGSQLAKSAPFLYQNGVLKHHRILSPEERVREVLAHGTLAIGWIGLANALTVLFGKHHAESKEAYDFGLKVAEYIHNYAKEMTEKHQLNFSSYATPAESLCGTFLNGLRKDYGIIEGVTDRDYLTNSFHIPVYYEIPAHKKIELEAPFHQYSTGGCISYIELDGNARNNLEAMEDIVLYALDKGVRYMAINHPIDSCECGYEGIIGQYCPRCGGKDGEVKICRLRRVK